MEKMLYCEVDCVCAVILLLVLILRRAQVRTMHSQLVFTVLSSLVITVLLSDGFGVLIDGIPGRVMWFVTWFMSFYCDAAASVVCGLWFWYTRLWLSDPEEISFKKNAACMIPAGVGVLVMFLNIPFGFVYTVDSANVYHRGPAFFIIFIIPFVYILMSFLYAFCVSLREKNTARRKKSAYITLLMVLPVIGSVIQLISYGLPLIWPSETISLLAIYFSLQARKDEDERITIEQLKFEMMKKDVSIMLSQIQPHFLYNALTTIKGLTMTDPDKACEAIDNFSFFLRGNMDSLFSTENIPFTQEIDHTKLYLSLEEMRFGPRLKVEYDLQVTDFSVPPLTLQPIVENAVRYGVTKKKEGGTIRISSFEENGIISVSVSDNGTGFDPMQKQADGRSHVGIQNVRDRLRKQCGGDLLINSVKGKGTTVEIVVPAKREGETV